MKLLKPILIGLAAFILLLALIGLFLPSAAHVERSVRIAAPPGEVYAIVNDLHRFNDWSPWFEKDPKAKYSYTGPQSGVGARVEWQSKVSSVGSGSQEIVESVPEQRVRTKLDFGSSGTATAQFLLAPEGTGTGVTWALDTTFGGNLLARYFGLAMDSMVGTDYEQGLGNLKALAESALPAPAGQTFDISEVDVMPRDIAYVEGTTSLDPDAISKALAAAYSQIGEYLQAQALTQKGAPLAINRFYDESGWGFQAGIPVAGLTDASRSAASASSIVKLGQTYSGRALKGVHIGDHSTLPDAYRALEDYMVARGLDSNGPSWEEYVSDPVATPPEKLQTDVFMPVKAGAAPGRAGTAH
ncbi:MAG TPA: SRPBCC family protein [Steroidobacteraceae bacterium]|nr:SRPBCC family protein [Steroidobacteraceae bacterium]